MKDPAFLFYPNDYIGGTMGWTFEQKGAYMELLMMQFNRGHMTSDMVGHTLGQSTGQSADNLWSILKVKFEQDPEGNWFNRRLEDEITKRKAYSDSRRNNLKGENQYTKTIKKEGHMRGHMTSHMENENENENNTNSKNKKGVKNFTKKEREEAFREQVQKEAADKYSSAMVQAFADYWTESNPTGHKLKFETQQIFDIGRRLATWAGKDFNGQNAARSLKVDVFAKGQSNF